MPLRARSRLLLAAALLSPLAIAASCAGRRAEPSVIPPRLAAARQLVVVVTPGWDATSGTLVRYARESTREPWRAEGDPVAVVVGRSGLAWGMTTDAEREGEPRKREGDGRAPAGVFPLDTAFGFAPPEEARGIRLPYVMLGPGTDCVDDSASAHYNTVVDRETVTKVDWSSAEHMRSVDQYRIGVIVGYNASPPRKGRGSCIFLHIWKGPGSSTAGCTAFDAAALEQIMQWLDPARAPVLVQLTADAHARLRGPWQLP